MAGTASKLTVYTQRQLPSLGDDKQQQLYLQQELAAIAFAIATLNAAIRNVESRLVAGGL